MQVVAGLGEVQRRLNATHIQAAWRSILGADWARLRSLACNWHSRVLLLAPKEWIVTIQNLARIESFILRHLLFHEVLHYAWVEVVAGSLRGHMVIFWVIEKGPTTLIPVVLSSWLLLARSCHLIWIAHIAVVAITTYCLLISSGALLLIIWFALCHLGYLVNNYYLCELCCVFEALELCVEELGTWFNGLIQKGWLLGMVITRDCAFVAN